MLTLGFFGNLIPAASAASFSAFSAAAFSFFSSSAFFLRAILNFLGIGIFSICFSTVSIVDFLVSLKFELWIHLPKWSDAWLTPLYVARNVLLKPSGFVLTYSVISSSIPLSSIDMHEGFGSKPGAAGILPESKSPWEVAPSVLVAAASFFAIVCLNFMLFSMLERVIFSVPGLLSMRVC